MARDAAAATRHEATYVFPFQAHAPLETMNCTVYGTLNAIETMISRIFHVEPNYSERFIGVLAGTTQGGNSPHKVAETIRKAGLVPDSALPFRLMFHWTRPKLG